MSHFAKTAVEAARNIHVATIDEDAEWQRVNSYIADALKDTYVLFAKLARLRGDFSGPELDKLEEISSSVREIGQEMSAFSKAFSEGEYSMVRKEQYGSESGTEFEPDFSEFDSELGEGEGEEEFTPEEDEGGGEEEFTPEEGEGEGEKKSEK